MSNTQATNGKATTTAASKAVELSNSVVSAPEKGKDQVTEVKPEPKKEEVKKIPVADRISKIQELADLCEKHETLTESLKKLQSFKFQADGHRDTITLEDSKGNEWTTGNSRVTLAVFETMKKELQSMIADVEAQIKF